MQSFGYNTRYIGGSVAGVSVFIVAVILVVGGFYYYRGALNQKEALESQLLPPPAAPVTTEEPYAMENAVVEIGAEDEMILVPEEHKETAGAENVPPEASVKEFAVTGINFSFSETEIRVRKGDKVRINFKSESGFHDWVVDAFNAKTKQVSGGQSSSVEFTADTAGTFEYYCSVGSHRSMGMVGKLIVEDE